VTQTAGLCSVSAESLLFIVVASRDLPESGFHDYNLRRILLCVCVCVWKRERDWRRVSLFYFNWVSLNISAIFLSFIFFIPTSHKWLTKKCL